MLLASFVYFVLAVLFNTVYSPRPQQIMTPPSHLIDPILLQTIPRDRNHWSHIRQAAPQPISNANMTLMQLSGARGPEAFARVMCVPDVEVANLWTGRSSNATYLTSGEVEGVAGAYGEEVEGHQAFRRFVD